MKQLLMMLELAVLAAIVGLSRAPAATQTGALQTGATPSATRSSATRPLVVCADPNNLPFSNSAGEGFENKIAALLAQELGSPIEYVWWAQRRGFVRNTLNEQKCDLWPGIASGVDKVATTVPYYRSTYVFVTRADKPLRGLTLDDARLKSLAIGVQMVGDNAMNTPPAHALARRGVISNVKGYMLYGNYDRPNPPAAIVKAVENGDIDVALVWGPLAGYFAHRSAVPLRLEPITPQVDAGIWPMAYDISMGVRRNDSSLKRQIESFLEKDRPEIDALLLTYDVPRAPLVTPQ